MLNLFKIEILLQGNAKYRPSYRGLNLFINSFSDLALLDKNTNLDWSMIVHKNPRQLLIFRNVQFGAFTQYPVIYSVNLNPPTE